MAMELGKTIQCNIYHQSKVIQKCNVIKLKMLALKTVHAKFRKNGLQNIILPFLQYNTIIQSCEFPVQSNDTQYFQLQ